MQKQTEVSASSGGTWTVLAPMPEGREGMGAGVLNGRIYVVGGDNKFSSGAVAAVEVYDPATNTWSKAGMMPVPRFVFNRVAVINDVLYVAGGEGIQPAAPFDALDGATGQWNKKAPVPRTVNGGAVAALNGLLYAVGGQNTSTKVAAYDPNSNTWTFKADAPVAGVTAAEAINGMLYVIGGYNEHFRRVAEYNPATDSWKLVAPLPFELGRFGAATVLGGQLYVIGGCAQAACYSRLVEAYDPGTNTWASKTPMPMGLDDTAAVSLGGAMYLIGGQNDKVIDVPGLRLYKP
ncbi:MAG TPA: kelch repeat-containing protein [Candidatus Baltobacteraceae bacterium]|nr:kelch repeat-containing protein [Candidatus Baltobacteraceae bacterium]